MEIEKIEKQLYLVCQECEAPIATADEIITEKYQSLMKSHVFAYELDIMNTTA